MWKHRLTATFFLALVYLGTAIGATIYEGYNGLPLLFGCGGTVLLCLFIHQLMGEKKKRSNLSDLND